MIITPSLPEKNIDTLFHQISKQAPYITSFQIDIADGVDVPTTTVKIEEIITRFQKSDITLFKHLAFEFHLMVKEYVPVIGKISYLKRLITIQDILIHAKYLPDISMLYFQYKIPVGLVLYPEDPVSLITEHYELNTIPLIQIMSCRVGFQGTPFIEESLDKIEQLRELNYRNKISLDGGVNEKTMLIIMSKKYTPDIICPGSFLTNAVEVKKNIEILNSFIPT